MTECGVWVPVEGNSYVASCSRPAELTWDVRCPADPEHDRQVSTCEAHEMAAGQVGCLPCLLAGRDTDLRFSAVIATFHVQRKSGSDL